MTFGGYIRRELLWIKSSTTVSTYPKYFHTFKSLHLHSKQKCRQCSLLHPNPRMRLATTEFFLQLPRFEWALYVWVPWTSEKVGRLSNISQPSITSLTMTSGKSFSANAIKKPPKEYSITFMKMVAISLTRKSIPTCRWIFYFANGGISANNYQKGESEQYIGEWMKKRGVRDQMVISTKFTTAYRGTFGGGKEIIVNTGGNGAKSLHLSLQKSLENLQTSYIDLVSTPWSRNQPSNC